MVKDFGAGSVVKQTDVAGLQWRSKHGAEVELGGGDGGNSNGDGDGSDGDGGNGDGDGSDAAFGGATTDHTHPTHNPLQLA